MGELREKTYQWASWPHDTESDEKGHVYCRAFNRVMKFETGYCQYCPLWNGDRHKVQCRYFDFEMDQKGIVPGQRKAYVDGLIMAGFTKVFPDFVTEDYGEKRCMLGRQAGWKETDWLLVEAAYQFAAMAHQGAKRKCTQIPYLTHPMETAYYAFQMSQDPRVAAAALLHDVVEDTPYELKEIEERFGSKVAELVGDESEDKRRDLPPAQSWKIRKEAFLNHLAHATRDAKIITLADKLSNIKATQRSLEEVGDQVWERFNQKDKRQHAWYYLEVAQLTQELSEFREWQHYMAICRQVFGEAPYEAK